MVTLDVQHGFCSHYADLGADIYPAIADLLWTHYDQNVRPDGACGQCVTIDRDFVHLATFLHQDADETTDQHGGFFLYFAFRNEFCHLGFTPDTAQYNVAYEWQLTTDGGTVQDICCSGPSASTAVPCPCLY